MSSRSVIFHLSDPACPLYFGRYNVRSIGTNTQIHRQRGGDVVEGSETRQTASGAPWAAFGGLWAFWCRALRGRPPEGRGGAGSSLAMAERRGSRREARGAGEPVLLDGAPDQRRYRGVFGVSEVELPSWRRAAIWPALASRSRRRSWRGCCAADRERG